MAALFLRVSHMLVLVFLVNCLGADAGRPQAGVPSKGHVDPALEYHDVATENALRKAMLEKSSGVKKGPQGSHRHLYKRDLKQIKSLKLRLEWFDKSTDALVGGEYSRDLRDDGTVIEQLGLSIANNVNNGGYDVLPSWVGILQPYFKHRINQGAFDYQVAFDYREWWEDMRVISFELFDTPGWRNDNGRLVIPLVPNVSGDIVRAVYNYHGLDLARSMMRINLLGTSFDCDLGTRHRDIEFSPKEKRLNAGQAFEVSHTERATRTNHGRLSFTKPLEIKITLTVRVKV